jgi:hypothetical protein
MEEVDYTADHCIKNVIKLREMRWACVSVLNSACFCYKNPTIRFGIIEVPISPFLPS